MIRKSSSVKSSAPLAAGLAIGLIAAATFGGAADPSEAAVQDANAVFQLQQQLNILQMNTQTRLDMMQAKIDTLERTQQNFQFRVQNAERSRAAQTIPTPNDPLPGTWTMGRLVSEQNESQLFALTAAGGRLLAQIGNTSDGPGLVLFDPAGGISAALLATPQGPELRMRDTNGELQTVLSGQ